MRFIRRVLLSVGRPTAAASRSASVSSANSAIANSDRITTAAYARARQAAAASTAGTGSRARSSSPPLGEHGADHRDRDRDLGAGEHARQRGRAARRAGTCAAREASKVRISLIRSGSTPPSPASVVTTIEKNDTSAITTSLGRIPKPSHNDEHRREIGDRDRLRGDQQRIDGAAQRRREVDRDRAARSPATVGQRAIPSSTSLGGDQEVAPQQRAVGVERLGHRVRGGQDQRVGAAEVDVQLPGADQERSSSERRAGQRRRSIAAHAATPSASQRALAQRDDRGIGAPARPRQRDRDLGDDPARTRRHHDDAVGEHDRLLDVVGDQHDRARLACEHVRRASPASPGG